MNIFEDYIAKLEESELIKQDILGLTYLEVYKKGKLIGFITYDNLRKYLAHIA